jgi:PAS domain S-box-containing protein
MTVERRIQTTLGVLLLFVLGTVMILFWSSRQVEDGIRRIDSASEAVKSAFMLSVLMNEYLEHGSKRSLRQWEKHREALARILNDMSSESIDRTLLRDLQDSFQAVDSLSPQLMQMASRESDSGIQDRRVRDMLGSLMSLRLEQLVRTANDVSRASQTLTLNRRHFVQKTIVAGGISLVIVILVNIYLIRKSVVRPLKVLAGGVEKIGEGKFDAISETKSDDEVGRLGRAFNAMIERLEKRDLALRNARDELEQKVLDRTAELRFANEKLTLEIEERERAEQAVEGERRRLYDILETMPVMVCLLTPDYRVAFANRSFREKFGENDGRHCFDYCFGQEEPCESCESHRVLETGKPHYWEVTAPDGSFIAAHDFPFTDTDGSPLILEVNLDITDRKEAERLREEALENSEILNKIFSTTHFCIVFLDRDFNFIKVNQAYADSCGYPTDFFPGKNHFELYPHDENESIFRKVVETGETFTIYAKPFEFPDAPDRGTTYWDWTLHPVKDPQGRVEALIFILLEVTERETAEQALRESENRYRQMFQKNWAVKLLIDPDSSAILDANQAASEFYGYELDSLKQMKMTDINVLSAEEIFQEMSEACAERKNCFQFRHRLASGETRYVEVYSTPIDLYGKKLLYSIIHDITARHRAQEELVRSNQDLEKFAYVASHDLQEPLRSVAGALQLLEKRYKGHLGSDADQFIKFAVDAVKAMKQLIEDLLAYSRIGTRGNPFRLVEVEQVLGRALANLRSAVFQSQAEITCDPLPELVADPVQLAQVFQNLILNAIKFRREEAPRVHVTATKEGDKWVFSVRDNGIGIEERHLDRIFIIFQRLHNKNKYEGSGIGLAIAKKIVERHGGRIWAESEFGRGTTFYFTIPIREATQQEKERHGRMGRNEGSGNLTR